MEARGAGEILLMALDRDGTMSGYDAKLVGMVADVVRIPVITCGGAASLANMDDLVTHSNVSLPCQPRRFSSYGPHRASLINPPTYQQLMKALEG